MISKPAMRNTQWRLRKIQAMSLGVSVAGNITLIFIEQDKL